MAKQILVLGGTGAMGKPLVEKLVGMGHEVTVTTRSNHPDTERLHYRQGSAREEVFLYPLLEEVKWDAVVDFMVYNTSEFAGRAEKILSLVKQYIFISSARVYAQSDNPITEETPRLLDTSRDEEYLRTDEYALTKARQENILINSRYKNWTIIRPSITYNDYRLQLGVLEKENWLYRALHGRSIVFSQDIADKITTMTWGQDVADGIASVVAKPTACGEIYHVTEQHSERWQEVLTIYLNTIQQITGKRPNVIMTKKSDCFVFPGRKYQIIYCRYFNRHFDSSKIGHFTNVEGFKRADAGLAECLRNFLQNPVFRNIDWCLEGVLDRSSKEVTPLSEIDGVKNKLKYLMYRYQVPGIFGLYKIAVKGYKRIKIVVQ